MKHISTTAFEQQLPHILEAPKEAGRLEMIVIRPRTEERRILESCELSAAKGVHGDNWADGCWKTLDDGSPHPDVQISIINSRVMKAIEADEERRSLAGDNLYVDLDLSDANVSPGQQFKIGTAVIEVTDTPHNGCKKFMERFGESALKYINSSLGKQHHLRGIFAKVITDGRIKVGDWMQKI